MKKLLFAIPFLAAVLVACPDPVTPPQTIGSSGGTVSSSNTVASVVFPAGALSVDTPVTITDAVNPPTAPSGQVFVPGKSFTVAGGTGNFVKPAELKIKLTPSEVASLNLHNTQSRALVTQVIVLQLNGSSWITITYTFDTATNVLTVSIPGYGTYAVVVPPTPPAPTLASIVLSCSPTSIQIGFKTVCFTAAKDSSSATIESQPTMTYASSDTGKATVLNNGDVTGVAAGSSNITASSGGITSNAVAVTVTAASTFGNVMISNAVGGYNGAVIFTPFTSSANAGVIAVSSNIVNFVQQVLSVYLPAATAEGAILVIATGAFPQVGVAQVIYQEINFSTGAQKRWASTTGSIKRVKASNGEYVDELIGIHMVKDTKLTTNTALGEMDMNGTVSGKGQ